MFFPNSRYANAAIATTRMSSGATVAIVRLPIRPRPALRGFHRRNDVERLDSIAAHYLGDATAFWRLCDCAGALAPDALAARELVAIPVKGR